MIKARFDYVQNKASAVMPKEKIPTILIDDSVDFFSRAQSQIMARVKISFKAIFE